MTDAALAPPRPDRIRVLATDEPMTVDQVRAQARAVNAVRVAALSQWLLPSSEDDRTVAGPAGDIPIRVLRPAGTPVATIVYFHGGGWIVGDLDTHLAQARRLCVLAQAVVVSVDYRIAPEHRFPAAFDDAVAAAVAIDDRRAEFGGPGPLVVAGDGSGAQLAASVAIAFRDAARGLAAQILLHPVTDVAGRYAEAEINASYMSRWTGKQRSTLTLDALASFAQLYVDADDAADWRVSPKRAASLAGVAPAVIHTSTLDVLRTEGNFYADDLRAAGVPVISREFPSLNHSYFGLDGVSAVADAAAGEAADDLRELLARATSETAAPR